MSGFNPIKAGGYSFGDLLTSAQMNQLNSDIPFALDGRDGGSYAPTSPIVIGGAGVNITGSVAVNGASAQCTPSCNFSNDITVGGTGIFTNDIIVDGNVRALSNVICTGYVRGIKRTAIGSAAAGTVTYAMASVEHVYLTTSAAAGTIWQISLTGANSQECMRFYHNYPSSAVVVKDPGGTTLATLSSASGQPIAITVQNNAGTCVVIDISYHP